jgi:hypothetical protein
MASISAQTISLVVVIGSFLPLAPLQRALRLLPQITSPSRSPVRHSHRFLRSTPIRLMRGAGWTYARCQATITDDTCPHCQLPQKQSTSPPSSSGPDDWATMIASPPPSSPLAYSSPDTPHRSPKRPKLIPCSCSVRIPSSQFSFPAHRHFFLASLPRVPSAPSVPSRLRLALIAESSASSSD